MFFTARTPREMIASIRLADFDLTVVGLEPPNVDVWNLMQNVTQLWPRLRWIVASDRVTAEEEVSARSLGALVVLNAMPDDSWLEEFAASLRRRNRVACVDSVPVDLPLPLSQSA